MDEVMATIVCFVGSFVPRGWLACDGQTLPISQNQALFSLLGTTYGGDGRATFRLPDLRGRSGVSAGQSPFHNYALGESAGSESVTLDISHIPGHSHNCNIDLHLSAYSAPGDEAAVNNGYPSDYTGAYATSGVSAMSAPDYKVAIANTGSGAPIDPRSPFLVIQHIICIDGIFPSRG
jgi:microcystin-dependent protein